MIFPLSLKNYFFQMLSERSQIFALRPIVREKSKKFGSQQLYISTFGPSNCNFLLRTKIVENLQS